MLIRSSTGINLEDKLKNKLHFYFGNKYDDFIGNRIIILNGDISENNLGLSSSDLRLFELDVDVVIGSAAKVTHFGNYEDFKKVNVNGTENLLKLCLKYGKRFYHISTLSVSGNTSVDGETEKQSFTEDVTFRENNFYIGQALNNVYVKSKFEAESLVLDYILKGLDAYILRVRKFDE